MHCSTFNLSGKLCKPSGAASCCSKMRGVFFVDRSVHACLFELLSCNVSVTKCRGKKTVSEKCREKKFYSLLKTAEKKARVKQAYCWPRWFNEYFHWWLEGSAMPLVCRRPKWYVSFWKKAATVSVHGFVLMKFDFLWTSDSKSTFPHGFRDACRDPSLISALFSAGH